MAWNLMKRRRDNLEKDRGDVSLEAERRFETLEHAREGDEDATKSGPFEGGGRKPGTSSGAFPFGSSVKPKAQAQPKPTPSPRDLELYHQREADKYKPGNQSVPTVGQPNLNQTEAEELAPDIKMRPRQ